MLKFIKPEIRSRDFVLLANFEISPDLKALLQRVVAEVSAAPPQPTPRPLLIMPSVSSFHPYPYAEPAPAPASAPAPCGPNLVLVASPSLHPTCTPRQVNCGDPSRAYDDDAMCALLALQQECLAWLP